MNIQQLADRVGVQLSTRSVSGGFKWDGKTIGTQYQDWMYDYDDYGWQKNREDAELLNYIPQFKAELKPMKVDDLCHEIAHWVVALPWCRDLPEYGLGIVDDGYSNANGGWHLQTDWDEKDYATQDGLLDEQDRRDQEHLAFALGLHYCHKVGVIHRSKWSESFWLLPQREKAITQICQQFNLRREYVDDLVDRHKDKE